MEQIFLPTGIEFLGTDNPNIDKVVITPCHQGYGTTLGNALRRVLLSSLPGAAVESVKIQGVQHEFSALDGVQEDVIEIILNLKQLSVISHVDEPVTLTLSKKGLGKVTARDFSKHSSVEIVNPEFAIATITDAATTLEMEITIGRGRGYMPVSEKETKHLSLGTIAIDSLYTPIRDVGYAVEMTRVGDVTDFEKLTLTIETNGTVTPRAALGQATKILMDHFSLILNHAEQTDEVERVAKENLAEVISVDEDVQEVSRTKAEDMPAKKARKKAKKSE